MSIRSDWIDKEKERRDCGITRPLTQTEHAQVNSRYPGCTLEYCCECGEPTGGAGRGEDSLYIDDKGPFCSECYQENNPEQVYVVPFERKEP